MCHKYGNNVFGNWIQIYWIIGSKTWFFFSFSTKTTYVNFTIVRNNIQNVPPFDIYVRLRELQMSSLNQFWFVTRQTESRRSQIIGTSIFLSKILCLFVWFAWKEQHWIVAAKTRRRTDCDSSVAKLRTDPEMTSQRQMTLCQPH